MRAVLIVLLTLIVLSLDAEPAAAQVIASSDFDDGPQGWTFDIAAAWQPTSGNPGGCLHNFGEETNGPAWAIASPAFLGDWTSLNDRGTLTFDHRRVTNGGGSVLQFVPIIIEVSGPAGTATWNSPLLPAPGPWRQFAVPIRRDAWSVASEETWLAILADVTRVRFFLEQVSNTNDPEDLNLLDNVALQAPETCPADFNADGFVNPDDLSDFITCFFLEVQFPGTCPDADFNADAFTNPDDLSDFITAFFTSAC
jgi:hypothetical protein